MANPGISQLLTSTLNNQKEGKIEEQISNVNALFRKLQNNGNIVREDGGVTFREALLYNSNGTLQWQSSAYDLIDTSPQDVVTAADFDQKQLTGSVTYDHKLEVQNAGKERRLDLVMNFKKAIMISFTNELGSKVYGDGTGSGGNELQGLQNLVADDPTTGTVGGINRASASWWRNQLVDFSVDTPGGSGTAAATNILDAMNLLFKRCTVSQGETPDFAVAGTTYHDFFLASLQANQRFLSGDKAMAGFNAIKYMNMDVVYDPQCSATRMYMLNTKHLKLKYLSQNGNIFEALEARRPVNQPTTIIPMIMLANLTSDAPRTHGVLIA